MERNKQLKIIQVINTEINELERERNVYLNLLCRDINEDTEEFILVSVREINEDIVYLEKILKEIVSSPN